MTWLVIDAILAALALAYLVPLLSPGVQLVALVLIAIGAWWRWERGY